MLFLSFMTLKLKVEFEEGADVDAVIHGHTETASRKTIARSFYKKNRVSKCLCCGGSGSHGGR